MLPHQWTRAADDDPLPRQPNHSVGSGKGYNSSLYDSSAEEYKPTGKCQGRNVSVLLDRKDGSFGGVPMNLRTRHASLNL